MKKNQKNIFKSKLPQNIINNTMLSILDVQSPEEAYKIITEEAVNIFNADSGSLFLAEDDVLERVYTSLNDLKSVKVRKKGNAYYAYKNRKIFVVDTESMKKIHPKLTRISVKSMLMIPLFFKNKSIGVLTLNYLKKIELDKGTQEEIKTFSSLATLRLRNIQLFYETKKALETRDLFISMATHELRTPLTSINGYVQLLHSRLANGEGNESRWIRELYMETKRMTNMVMELLEISRIQRGMVQFEFKECCLSKLTKDAIEYLYTLYPNRQVHFLNKVEDKKDKIIGDSEKLLQVIKNLLENAIKFSSHEKDINVELFSKNNSLYLRFSDKGVGIEKKNISRILKGFYKSNKEGFSEGMGVGLYFVKNIVDKHHGNISIKSKLKKGTTVEIQFPRLSA